MRLRPLSSAILNQQPRHKPRHLISSAISRIPRREAILLGITGTLAAVSGVFGGEKTPHPFKQLQKETGRENEDLIPRKEEAWGTGEYSRNKIDTFMYVYLHLDEDSVIFVDQNGNMVTGQPIPIPPAVLAQEKSKNFQGIFQKWLNEKREELAKTYPTLFLRVSENREEPTLLSVRRSGVKKGDDVFSKVLENSRKRTDLGISRYEHAARDMQREGMPSGLVRLFLGAWGVESQFSQIGCNEVGACGPFQIMEDEARKYGLMGKKSDDRNDFEKASPVAAKIIKRNFEKLRQSKGGQIILSTYGVSEEDFLFPAVLNSYQGGLQRVLNMFQWFIKTYPLPKLQAAFGKGPYGRDLYTFMASMYIHAGEDRLFGKQTRDYSIRAMAMADLFAMNAKQQEPEFAEGYTPPSPAFEPEYAPLYTSQADERMVTAGALLGVGLLVAERAVSGNVELTRRNLLQLPLFGGVGALSAFAASSMASTAPAVASAPKPEPEVPRPPEPEKAPAEVPQEEAWRYFGKYYLNEALLWNALLNDAKNFSVPHQTDAEISKLRDPMQKGLDIADRNKLPRFAVAGDIPRPKGMKQLPQYNSLSYRLRGVGQLQNGKNNDSLYTYCYEHTEQLINEIDERLNQELQKQGFPARFHVRLIVSALSRSEKFQKALRKINPYASKRDSGHMFGHTFDIQRFKFDIIARTSEDSRHFCLLSDASEDPVNNSLRLSEKINGVLGRIIMEMKKEGKLIVIHEGRNPVYHISDTLPLGA